MRHGRLQWQGLGLRRLSQACVVGLCLLWFKVLGTDLSHQSGSCGVYGCLGLCVGQGMGMISSLLSSPDAMFSCRSPKPLCKGVGLGIMDAMCVFLHVA